jgi:membrane protein DedA with SNARE-associated domain
MDLLHLFHTYGLPIVLGSVVAGQGGIPLPAASLLMVAAALPSDVRVHPLLLVALGVAASLVADHIWYFIGRTKGAALFAWLQGTSSRSPAAVGAVRRLVQRHGAFLLVFGKFLPGVHTLVVPASAAMKLGYLRFLAFNTLGALLWVGVYVLMGSLLGPQVRVLAEMGRELMTWAGAALLVVAVVWLAIKMFGTLVRMQATQSSDMSYVLRGDDAMGPRHAAQ